MENERDFTWALISLTILPITIVIAVSHALMRRLAVKNAECDKRKVNTIKNGFTLLEVLLALVIFAVGILGVAPLFICAPRYNQSSHAMTEAAILAQSRFEEFKTLEYDAIANGQDNVQASTGITFTRQWTTENQGNAKIVRCVVTWQDWIGHRIDFFYAYPNL